MTPQIKKRMTREEFNESMRFNRLWNLIDTTHDDEEDGDNYDDHSKRESDHRNFA